MEQSAAPGVDRQYSEPAGIVMDATGPPVLNEAAAGVLLRILLRAAERHGMANVTHLGALRVRSDS
ncbi:MAG: hypothetical protein P1T08_18340 [Acidimicrobiia bacterium]|nr:hypothetical protein [Acidimicrobiia bacterium]